MSETTNVISIGTLNVEDGSGYLAAFQQSFTQPETTITRVQRDGDSPVVTHVAPGLHEYLLEVLVEDGADPDTLDARRRALLGALDSARGPITVTIENATGTARQRYMTFVNRKTDQVEGKAGRGFLATLEAADEVRWRATTAEEATWTLNASGTRTLNVLGDLDAYPTYTITPNSAKATPNWAYYRRCVIQWRSPFGGLHPVDITGGGLNTTALIGAGKITDSSNIGVTLNGRFVPFWFGGDDGGAGGFNSTTTRIWVNVQATPETYCDVDGYVTAADTTWRVENDEGLPPSGTLLVDSEYVQYTRRAPGYLYGVQRGMYGSSAAAHVVGAECSVVYVAYILYGPNAEVPAGWQTLDYVSGGGEPIMLNSGSTNGVWRFDEFAQFRGTGNWQFLSQMNNAAFVSESAADGTYDAAWGYPWEAMGFRPGWASLNQFYTRFALPIKTLRVLGRRRAVGSPADYLSNAKLYVYSNNQREWITAWNAAVGAPRTSNDPFDETSWEFPFRAGEVSGGHTGYNRVLWQFTQANYLQVDIQQMVVTFWPSTVPVVTVSGELTDYDIDLTLKNETTGEYIRVNMPDLEPGHSLVIDSRRQTVAYTKDGSSRYTAVQRNAPRARFLRLVPGTNEFEIAEDGMGDMEIVVRYEPRWYT